MRIFLLLIGIQLAYAVTNKLEYFYTAATEMTNFPRFVDVGKLNGEIISVYDSTSQRKIPRQKWMADNLDQQYWDSSTESLKYEEQVFFNNIQVAMKRFNQTAGVHTFQLMYGCERDDQTGETNAFRRYGYDGEDFLSLDMKEMRWITPVQQGFPTMQKLNNDRDFIESDKHYFHDECVEWLQKYLEYGKSSLQKTVSPQVSLLQTSSSSPVSCHATGFYPSEITITWMKNGEEHHEDVDLGELLPNEDGTFQKRSSITVTPEEWKNNKFICVVKHQGKFKTADEIRTNRVSSGSVLIGIIGVVAAVLILVIGVTGFLVYRRKKGFKPVSASDNSSPEKPKGQTSLNNGSGSYSGSDRSIDSASSDNSSDSTTTLIRRDTRYEKSEKTE